jgi:hypothetical protein
MILLRRLNSLVIWFAVAAFLIGMPVSRAVAGQKAKSPPATQAGSDDPNSPDYRPGAEHKGGRERDALLATVKETLDTFKPDHGKLKADDDLFVVGTIDLRNHHAIVDFVVQEGVQQTADFIADFVLGKTRGVIREWRVFGRAKTAQAAEAIRARAKSQSIEGKLAKFKLSTSGLKTPDDYFVIGTADMTCATMHADIRFEILSGVKNAADFLIDFIFNRTKDHKGEWHVFYRTRTEAQATDYRQQMRDWYDSLTAQRDQIASIYKAKTTTRC